jgi:hypothetical protein
MTASYFAKFFMHKERNDCAFTDGLLNIGPYPAEAKPTIKRRIRNFLGRCVYSEIAAEFDDEINETDIFFSPTDNGQQTTDIEHFTQ